MKNIRKKTSDTDLRKAGIEALSKSLGLSGAYRFMSFLRFEPTDYVQFSKDLYKNQSVDEIFKRSKGHI
jgi:hypothetical protein